MSRLLHCVVLVEVEVVAVVNAAVVVRRDVGVCACGVGRDGRPSRHRRIVHDDILDVTYGRLACPGGMMLWET